MTAIFTVFLDRDGVINEKATDGHYVTSWAEFRFIPGVVEAMRDLHDRGARLVVVTNQRGIARGVMTEAVLADIHERMKEHLDMAGASVDALLVCPHEIGTCDCRKPLPGMFLQAAARFPDIDFRNAAVVGDSLSDLVPGAQLGCRTFLVGTDHAIDRISREARAASVQINGTGPSLGALVAAGQLDPGVLTR